MRFIKKTVTKTLSRRVLVRSSKRLVFLYHDVSEPGDFQHSTLYSTSPASFREQVEFLARHFELVPLDAILSQKLESRGKSCASITFDDGFLSVKQTAMPYLNARGISFAVFVNRMAMVENRLLNESEDGKLERTGAEKVFLDEDDVRSMVCNGVTIGSHTATHRKLAACDEQALHEEIDENKIYLEQVTGQPVRHLALPFGKREHYNEHVLAHCREAGHEFIFSTNPTWFDLSSTFFHRRLIPRIPLTGQTIAELTFIINRPLLKEIDI